MTAPPSLPHRPESTSPRPRLSTSSSTSLSSFAALSQTRRLCKSRAASFIPSRSTMRVTSTLGDSEVSWLCFACVAFQVLNGRTSKRLTSSLLPPPLAGLGRLGTGVQVDALSPTLVPQFSGTNPLTRCAKIAAGPANTLFIDNQGLLSLCGKWKLTGDGSSGQPWMTPKYVQDLMGYKWDLISAGGSTLFGYSRGEKDGDFTVAWGQNCTYGELAFGPGAVSCAFLLSLSAPLCCLLDPKEEADLPFARRSLLQLKSATKPQRVELLEGIEFLDIAAGQNTTFFIARPPPLPLAEGQPEVSPSPAPEAPAAASTAAEPVGGVDLSGFGYSFGAAAEAAAGDKKDVAKKPTIKKRGRSTTKEEEWNELGRYPAVLDAVDACKICGKEEGPEEALECEMVGTEASSLVVRITWLTRRLNNSARTPSTERAVTLPSTACPTVRRLSALSSSPS